MIEQSIVKMVIQELRDSQDDNPNFIEYVSEVSFFEDIDDEDEEPKTYTERDDIECFYLLYQTGIIRPVALMFKFDYEMIAKATIQILYLTDKILGKTK